MPWRLQGCLGVCTALALQNGVRKCRARQLSGPPASSVSGTCRTCSMCWHGAVTPLARVSHGRDLQESDRIGQSWTRKRKNISKNFSKNPPAAAAAHPFAPQPRFVPAVVFPWPWAVLTQPREGISGQGRATQSRTRQELGVARETAPLVMEASFRGYFLLLIVSPQPQVTESSPRAQTSG